MKVKAAARRAHDMPRSGIREIMSLAAGRSQVIHLEVGEPDFTTPVHIIDRACESLREGWTKYTSNLGLPSLRSAIADHVTRRLGRKIDPERVAVTVGAVGALFTSVMMVADAGDEVLVPDPGWPPYRAMVHVAGGRIVPYYLRRADRYQPDFEQIERLITPRTKALIINTPANPTGTVFDEAVVRRFVEVADRHGLYLISDEIYEDVVFEGRHVSAASFGFDDRVLLVSGVSKSYAMTGWRIGYLICPPGMAHLASGIQEPVVSCPPTVSQKAAEAALSGPQHCVREAAAIFHRRRDIVWEVLGEPGLVAAKPQGAFYALVSIGKRHGDSTSFAKALLAERDIATVPGITFGTTCDDTVRIAFTAADDALRTGVERLRDYVLGN